jgi:FtsP/CotA-like multicopper oxidase with cupredoxin domain
MWQRASILASAAIVVLTLPVFAQSAKTSSCPRPAEGSEAISPHEIRSQGGTLRVALALRSSVESNGEIRYCYADENGNQSPTLRLMPGDLLILRLKNELPNHSLLMSPSPSQQNNCTAKMAAMDVQSATTNLHFHGLTIPPSCHQDDVLHTAISPDQAAFEYRFQIPVTQPPGLYWYHPHPHGHSEVQVLGGASGALIVEGAERFNRLLAGLPERILIIRDQARSSTEISRANPKPPSKDLSVNFIPVPYPNYPLAIIKSKPSQRELWRVLNASADTFVELHLLMSGKWQSMGLVSVDGVPLGYPRNGNSGKVEWRQGIPIPPGGRAEFLFDTPAQGGEASLLTSGVDTVPPQQDDDDSNLFAPGSKPFIDDDDYTPPRWILKVVSSVDAAEPASILLPAGGQIAKHTAPALVSVHSVRERSLYFSEKIMDAKNPRTSTVFYITEQGHEPAAFDPAAAPNITVRSGDVEDWVIENRSPEIHTFHIHQTHFLLLERDDKAVNEPYLRDSVTLPYWDGISKQYPTVKLRMDFRDPAIVGTFPYHCHILQHEDGGMMGTIRVIKTGNLPR